MKKMDCDIIRDLLPLYIDGVVSDATKNLVETHLEDCDACRKEAEWMRETVTLPTNEKVQEAEVKALKKLKKRFFKKKVIVALVTACLTLVVAAGGYSYMAMAEEEIPYDSSKMKIEDKTGALYFTYLGDDLDCTYVAGPLKLQVDGEIKNVGILYYTTTPWSTHIQPLLEEDKSNDPFYGWSTDKIDQVYYGAYDIEGSIEEDDTTLLEGKQLIWEKE